MNKFVRHIRNYWPQYFAFGFLFLFIAISVIVIYYNVTINDKQGQVGDLLAGTVGVGCSFAAMLFIYSSLRDQKKLNQQVELQHLVENFNSRYDRFIDQFDKQIKDESRKEYLKRTWGNNGDDSIDTKLSGIFKDKVRNSTNNRIHELVNKFCKDNEHIRDTALGIKRLIALKEIIKSINSDAFDRIEYDFDRIEREIINVASFYLGWSKPNETLLSSKSKDSRLLASFLEPFISKYKIPELILRLIIKSKSGDPFDWQLNEFANFIIEIKSHSQKDIEIVKWKILSVPDNDEMSKVAIELNLSYAIHFNKTANHSYKIQLKDLLPKTELMKLFDFLSDEIDPSNLNTNESKNYVNEFIVKFNSQEWTHETKLGFTRYRFGGASLHIEDFKE